ncbi:type II secretion system protein [Sulfuricurvum sp.]|uniref:type II secretion system protein n=1 Tax=Sulfuricurvum sp. TaxID=2025608 RepID=UPI002605A036|nr:type II secretion system protein [Sulfuricurvum sp.]MDD4882831.1 type II secretion system protein [Sulfuricurvum sp.]
MKRSGFTMIELIFVIVILGILAAVAIPRLAATRDDAKIATKVQEATAVVSELGAYYTAHGTFKKLSEMTNVQLSDSATAENVNGGTLDLNGTNTVFLTDGKGVGCISYATTVAGVADGNLTVTSLTGASTICSAIRKALNDRNISAASPGITHKFGGSNVSFN